VVRSTLTEIDTDVSKAYGEKPASAEQGIKAKIFSSLQTELNEMFFSQVAVFVEGPEDRAYLSTYLHLMDLWEEFRKRGCHFVPVNGKSRMVRPVAIARRLGIPTFVMFDTDAAKWTEPRHNEKRKKHEKDNVAILSVCGHTGEKPFPDGHLYKNDLVAWRTEIGAVFKEDISTAEHATLFDTVNAEYGHVGDMDKNELAIADLVSHAWDADKKSKSIMQACEAIIRFSRSV
jgi:predicted ATP-dependent endonuclease of OLD family